jgi:hypothetical protein
MTVKTYFTALVFALALASCSNDAPQTSNESAPANSPDGAAQVAVPQGSAPVSVSPDASVTTESSQPAGVSTAGAAPAVNPPHGQPGHVCGKPVGAPLDGSAAASPAQSAPQTNPKTVTISPPAGASNNATVAPGTNPPHGQPGHVCGTPVGAPLPKQ